MSFSNSFTPRVRRFARFANAAYVAHTAEQACRLVAWAEVQPEPGFDLFARAAGDLLAEWSLAAPPDQRTERLPRPSPTDQTYLPVALIDEWRKILAQVAQDAYRRDDITAIARGSQAPANQLTKRGRTIYDRYGRPVCRVLLKGADAEVYRLLQSQWVDVPFENEESPGDESPGDESPGDELDFL